MDVIGNNNRNGLDSGYFNFLPAANVFTVAVAARKIKTKKYQNRETEQLAINFPHKLTSEEQNKMLQQLVSQQEKLIEARDKAKGKARAQVVGRLRAYDEYLKDVRDVRDELATKEQEALEQLESKNEEMKQTPSVEEKVKLDTTLADVTKTPSENLNTPKKDNTLLYVGLGVGALLLILLIRKK
jgi:phosphoglycerate-specific signal transduction histidine kinase